MAKIGKFNTMRVDRMFDFGVYLDGDNLGDILLPIKDVPRDCKLDDTIDAFVYLDSEDRLIATTRKPYAQVGEFALLRVAAVNKVGAFLEWGLLKDLLVPFREQKVKMEEGKMYVVYVYVDDETERIAASSNLDRFLSDEDADYELEQEVELFICNKTDLGYKAIINGAHWGVLYENEIFQEVRRGSKVKGFIKKIREDGKIDLSLQRSGIKELDALSQKILEMLKQHGGFMDVTDKTAPAILYSLFGMSKKNFKKAIGRLYKNRMIRIDADGIRLIESHE